MPLYNCNGQYRHKSLSKLKYFAFSQFTFSWILTLKFISNNGNASGVKAH